MVDILISCDDAQSVLDHFDVLNPGGSSNIGPRDTRRSWSTSSNTTPSGGVGPSSPQSGSGYIYTEASSPTVANDEFLLTWKDDSILPVSVDFYSNRRGNTIASLFVESEVGNEWFENLRIDGPDIPRNGNDVWRRSIVSLSPNAERFRFRVQMPPNGTIWHCDTALDNIIVSGDLPIDYRVSGVTRTYPDGQPAGNVELILMREISGQWREVDRQVSDIQGVFDFTVQNNEPHMIYANATDRFGCTRNTVIPTIIQTD